MGCVECWFMYGQSEIFKELDREYCLLIVLGDCIFNSDTQDNLEYRYIRIWMFSPQMLYIHVPVMYRVHGT